eukprot:TRINITY_DN22017_c0_g1_i1.p1 TRINITY_DN22017_c0_g1~~TRINITY_DN22017_c0_g1_i1.p1  ORF type:complete len:731 (+),score=100.66 TRINITY_DN22017_c0_g1_i1:78-2270(+)
MASPSASLLPASHGHQSISLPSIASVFPTTSNAVLGGAHTVTQRQCRPQKNGGDVSHCAFSDRQLLLNSSFMRYIKARPIEANVLLSNEPLKWNRASVCRAVLSLPTQKETVDRGARKSPARTGHHAGGSVQDANEQQVVRQSSELSPPNHYDGDDYVAVNKARNITRTETEDHHYTAARSSFLTGDGAVGNTVLLNNGKWLVPGRGRSGHGSDVVIQTTTLPDVTASTVTASPDVTGGPSTTAVRSNGQGGHGAPHGETRQSRVERNAGGRTGAQALSASSAMVPHFQKARSEANAVDLRLQCERLLRGLAVIENTNIRGSVMDIRREVSELKAIVSTLADTIPNRQPSRTEWPPGNEQMLSASSSSGRLPSGAPNSSSLTSYPSSSPDPSPHSPFVSHNEAAISVTPRRPSTALSATRPPLPHHPIHSSTLNQPHHWTPYTGPPYTPPTDSLTFFPPGRDLVPDPRDNHALDFDPRNFQESERERRERAEEERVGKLDYQAKRRAQEQGRAGWGFFRVTDWKEWAIGIGAGGVFMAVGLVAARLMGAGPWQGKGVVRPQGMGATAVSADAGGGRRVGMAVFQRATPGIMDLVDGNFVEIVRKRPTLVMFYTNDCVHCEAMRAAWLELPARLEELTPSVQAVQVNAKKAPRLVQKFQLKGVPTLLFFSGSTPYGRYTGPRDTQHLMAYVESRLEQHGVPANAAEGAAPATQNGGAAGRGGGQQQCRVSS